MPNKDALDAIDDIIEAIDEYGSDIKVVTEVISGYDPYTGPIVASTSVDMKGIISSEATQRVNDIFTKLSTDSYEMAIKLYSDVVVTKENKIAYKSLSYEILYVSEKSLQNTTILYEVLVRK